MGSHRSDDLLRGEWVPCFSSARGERLSCLSASQGSTRAVRLVLFFLVGFSAQASPAQSRRPAHFTRIQQPEFPTSGSELWGKKPPLWFEKNVGQLNSDVAYWARIGAGSVFLKTTEAAFVLRKAKSAHAARSFRMSWVGANRSASCEGEDELPGKANYFLGKDPSKWRQNVATYRKVRCRGVYPGVDLVFRGDEHQLEYDFVVAPSADPHRIALSFEGVDALDIDADGQLVLRLAGWRVVHRRPVLYQEFGNFRREVAGAFQRVGSNRVTFQLGRYDRNRALVIDPTLIFSTYLGGLGANDIGSGIAVDALGYVYVTGITDSTDFPTLSAFQPVANGQTQFDAFVSKLSPEGALVFSTYFGGTGIDEARAIAVDDTGAVYLSGGTTSADFPTANPFQ